MWHLYCVALVIIGLVYPAAGGALEARADVPLGAPMLLEQEEDRALLEEGRTHLFSMRLEAATDVFDALAERPDGAVAAAYHHALQALLQSVITDDDQYIAAFDERYEALREALNAVPESRWRTYLAAEARLMRTLMLAKQNRVVRAAFAARGAYSRYQDAASGAASFAEPYKGLGIFHLAIGSLPSGYQRVLSILGFSGSIEQGIRELEQARDGAYATVEATAYLGLIDVVIRYRTAEAVARFEALREAYPESPLMAYLLAYALLEDRQGGAALEVAQHAVRQGQQPRYFFVDYAEYYLAQALFRHNRFQPAATYYRRYLARHEGPGLRAPANLYAGLALELTERRAEAVVFYRRVQDDRDFDADQAAYREAQRRLDAEISFADRLLVRATNAFYAGQYHLSRVLLAQVGSAETATPPIRARARYYLGRVAYAQGQWPAAEQHFQRTLEAPGRRTDGLAPWSHFYLGQMRQAEGAADAAEAHYTEALNFATPFDYHQWLEQRVAAARETLTGGA